MESKKVSMIVLYVHEFQDLLAQQKMHFLHCEIFFSLDVLNGKLSLLVYLIFLFNIISNIKRCKLVIIFKETYSNFNFCLKCAYIKGKFFNKKLNF